MIVKQVISGLLFLSLLAHTFYQTAIVLSYYADKAAYAKNCENISIPLIHCNGKCQVMKKIREQEKRESNLPERKWEGKEVLSSDIAYTIPPASIHLLSTTYFSANSHGPLPCWHLSIFHPPQAEVSFIYIFSR